MNGVLPNLKKLELREIASCEKKIHGYSKPQLVAIAVERKIYANKTQAGRVKMNDLCELIKGQVKVLGAEKRSVPVQPT